MPVDKIIRVYCQCYSGDRIKNAIAAVNGRTEGCKACAMFRSITVARGIALVICNSKGGSELQLIVATWDGQKDRIAYR